VDETNWVEVDRHEEDLTLNFRNPVQWFACQKSATGFWFVRLRQIGVNQNSSPTHHMVISALRLFAVLTE
jgi:hypothetical protein